jgi:hypothetical protein
MLLQEDEQDLNIGGTRLMFGDVMRVSGGGSIGLQ